MIKSNQKDETLTSESLTTIESWAMGPHQTNFCLVLCGQIGTFFDEIIKDCWRIFVARAPPFIGHCSHIHFPILGNDDLYYSWDCSFILSSRSLSFSVWQYRGRESRQASNHEDVRNATFIMFHLVQYRKHSLSTCLHNTQGNELAKLSSHTCIEQKARTKTTVHRSQSTINTAHCFAFTCHKICGFITIKIKGDPLKTQWKLKAKIGMENRAKWWKTGRFTNVKLAFICGVQTQLFD